MAQDELFSRRQVLGRSLGVAFGAAAGLGVLAACGSDNGTSEGAGSTDPATTGPTGTGAATGPTGSGPTGSTSPSGASGGSVLPAYVPYDGVKPDGPSTDVGAEPYFAHYPAQPPSVLSGPPASGGSVTALCIVSKPPKPLASNGYWKALNTMLGAELSFIGAPNNNYLAKFATTVAGGQIPDLAQIYSTTTGVEPLLAAKFEDLTEFLAGDGIKKYPSLANIPPYCWPNAVYSGKLYGVPLQRPPLQTWGAARQPSIEAAGVDPQPKDGKEFIALCKALTNQRKSQWALRSPDQVIGWVNAMVGTPNVWQVDDGAFTSAYATPQYKQALGIVQQLWTSGYFEPDSLAASGQQKVDWYVNGRVPLMLSSSSFGTVATDLLADSGGKTVPIAPPKWEGGGTAKSYLGAGILTFTAVKKTGDNARTEELLRVLDALAAPFGTKEYLQKWYGVEGRDYTLDGTDPVQNDTGKAEWVQSSIYVANGPGTAYSPKYTEVAKATYEYSLAGLKNSAPWPVAGLYSATDQGKGAALKKKIEAVGLDIMVNRKPLSAWDAAVKTWKSEGGDTITAEYTAAYQHHGGS